MMSIPHSVVVDKMALLYSSGIRAFDYGMNPSDDAGICWAIARLGDVMVLIFRGSVTPEDWFRDFIVVPVLALHHMRWGLIPAGFNIGMDDAYKDIIPLLTMPFVVGAHSLGAARACRFMAQYDGQAPLLGGVLCGCPNPGGALFKSALDRYDITSYRNRFDPVPTVPTPPLYGPVRPFIKLNEAAATGDGIDNIEDHHIALYQQGVHRLEAAQTTPLQVAA